MKGRFITRKTSPSKKAGEEAHHSLGETKENAVTAGSEHDGELFVERSGLSESPALRHTLRRYSKARHYTPSAVPRRLRAREHLISMP